MLEKFKLMWMVNLIYYVCLVELKEVGIWVVFFDLDNILIVWNNLNGIKELKDWMMFLKEVGIFLIVIFNNSYCWVEWVVLFLNLFFVFWVFKLFLFGIIWVRMCLGFEVSEVVMVGD